MEKASRLNDQLISSLGSVLFDGVVSENDDQNKNFAVVAKCGHVGDGYFVPILFSTSAKDNENAKQIVRNFPRVKNHARGCILATKEISQIEDIFIKTINRYDSYLTYSTKKGSMEPRRILSSDFIDSFEKKHLDRRLAERRFNLKVAEDYPQHLTLQKYFAPSLKNDKIVYPKKIDMDFLLRDYFVSRTKYLGIQRGVAQILICYYKVFGPDNELGVTVDDEKVTYFGENGSKCEVQLDDFSRSTLKFKASSRLMDAIKAKTPKMQELVLPLEGEGKAKSGLERFNARMKKTNEMQRGGAGK